MKKFLSIVFLGLIITSNSMSYEEANYEVVKKNEGFMKSENILIV